MLTDQHLEDLLVTAIESGPYGSIDYGTGENAPAGVPFSVGIARAINAGGRIRVTDRYGDGEAGELNRAALVKALRDRARARNVSPESLCDGTAGDVIDADAIVQAAAFGEVIYA